MYPSTPLLLSLAITTLPCTYAQTNDSPTTRAETALSALQIWYNTGTGLWNTCGWWNSANAMTMVANLAKADNSSKVQDLAKTIFSNTITQAPAKNPLPGVEGKSVSKVGNISEKVVIASPEYDKSIVGEDGEYQTTYPAGWTAMDYEGYIGIKRLGIDRASAAAPNASQWLDGFYDDDLWWALAWINAYDVTGNNDYLSLAEGIFAATTKSWPSNCNNGGIYWSYKKDYVNAIANELFFSTAAHLANRVPDQKSTYVDWAQKELNWFMGSGMINSRGTINDGLTSACTNNNQTTWSYNQGVILGGLVELDKAAPSSNSTYLAFAAKTAKAAIAELSDSNGVLHDACGPLCGGDASQFKGIFARNLAALHAVAPDAAYVKTIQANANSIWANNKDQGNMLSINWAGPFIATANASTHSSAMDALVAAITVV